MRLKATSTSQVAVDGDACSMYSAHIPQGNTRGSVVVPKDTHRYAYPEDFHSQVQLLPFP